MTINQDIWHTGSHSLTLYRSFSKVKVTRWKVICRVLWSVQHWKRA